jgi:gliding motility-associated lipoprotein GldH
MSAYKKYRMQLYVTFLCCIAAMASCTQINVFEKTINIPGQKWQSNFAVKGSLTVADTASEHNVYIVIRHTDAYKYNNIWLNVGIQPPGDSMHYNKMAVELATDANGWMGNGMNDIWELRQLVYLPLKKSGNYNFSISQIMRDDPLPAIMSAGLRVEKR